MGDGMDDDVNNGDKDLGLNPNVGGIGENDVV